MQRQTKGRVSTRGLWWTVGAALATAACGPAAPGPGHVASAASALGTEVPVVIAQVYAAGGNANAAYTHDYVVLHNRSASPVTLDGWSLQYASATGAGHLGANASQLATVSGTICAGGFHLVTLATGAAAGTTPPGAALPAADSTGTINMGATAGKVALVARATSVGCNGGPTLCSTEQAAAILDLVGYGNASFFEGAAAPAPSAVNEIARVGDADTQNNAADFVARAAAPRNRNDGPSSCVADAAPAVVTAVPAPSATSVPATTSVSVTFSEPVALDAGALSLACSTTGAVAGAVAGGPTTYVLTPAAPLAAGETCTVSVAAGGVHDTDANDPPDTMASPFSSSFEVQPPVSSVRIHDVQGRAHLSPLAGQLVEVSGVVTVVRSNGFYLQDPTPDADDATSEAIFVFTSTAPAVSAGHAVRVSGRVTEFRPGCNGCAPTASAYDNLTTTELTSPSIVVESTGNPVPASVVIGTAGRVPPSSIIDDDSAGNVESGSAFDPAQDGIDFYESLEGMLVQLNDAIAVGRTVDFAGGAREIPVIGDGGAHAGLRTGRGGVKVAPGDFNPERVHLSNALAPLPDVSVGERFPGALVGVLDYGFGNFKLLATSVPAPASAGLQRETTSLARHAAQLTVATVNVENLDPGDPAEKIASLADIVVDNLQAPDLVALEEVQDDNGATNDAVTSDALTIAALTSAITAAGGPAYQYRSIAPEDDRDGGEPGGNIRVGLLFRTDRGLAFVDRPGASFHTANAVTNDGGAPRLAYSPGRIDPANPAFANSRKPLAGELTFNGRSLFVVANHFNSKGGDDPLFGRFQPPVLASEAQRNAQAGVVASFVEQILAVDAQAAVVVLGDLNDFEFSPPLATLKAAGLTTLVETLPPEERYTYVFEGNSQVLDHIMVSGALLSGATFDVVHVNAEHFVQASDHDPGIARLTLGTPPIITSAPPTTATQGQLYSYDVEASGGPAPVFSLGAAPAGMTIDAATGVITWTPNVAAGAYPVTVRATNGIAPDAVQTFTVSVAAATSPLPVRAALVCVSQRGLRKHARFAYQNPNAFPVNIPVGARNHFNPAPRDRGQPTTFTPGTGSSFEVPFVLPAIAWTLDGNTAVASVLSPRCR